MHYSVNMIQKVHAVFSGTARRKLVIIFHGYGASGDNIIRLADHWQETVKETVFLAPDAPHEMDGGGYYWFPVGNLEPDLLQRGCEKVLLEVVTFVRSMQEEYNVGWEQTCLVGFSQGAMLACCAALSEEKLCQRVIGYSGGLFMADHAIHAHPDQLKFLLLHGQADPVVPVSASESAAAFLKARGFALDIKTIPNLDHSIDEAGLRYGSSFLRD